MEAKKIKYGSDEYQATLALRNTVMRVPLGLSIFQEDFSNEKNACILGGFHEEQLLGVGVLSLVENKPEQAMVDYLCVANGCQHTGMGGMLLAELERIAKSLQVASIYLEARVSAQVFYEKKGYHAFGEVYVMEHAPVEHIKMKKSLTE